MTTTTTKMDGWLTPFPLSFIVFAGSKVFVGNLHEDVNQEELITTFLECGPIVEYKFVRQFAFFTFDDIGKATFELASARRGHRK